MLKPADSISAILITIYARHHFAYLKWEGELNMFVSFLLSSDIRSEGSIAFVKKIDFDFLRFSNFFMIFDSTSLPQSKNVF